MHLHTATYNRTASSHSEPSSITSKLLEILRSERVDWETISQEEFSRGLDCEVSHLFKYELFEILPKNKLEVLVKLVLTRLEEFPDYYTRLEKMEADGRANYYGL